MNTETLFTLKLRGHFSATTFVPNAESKIATITKFTDGTWELKKGREVLKDRFSTGYKFIPICLKLSLGIQL